MNRLTVLLPLFCILSACTTPRPAWLSRTPHLSYTEVLQHFAARPTGTSFVSRNGHMYGMDSDAKITFDAHNQAEVTEFGYAQLTYKGTYSVDASGAIHVSLRRYPAKWPSMYLYIDERGAILHPTDHDSSFRMGGRAGAVETSAMAPYWPFRQTK